MADNPPPTAGRARGRARGLPKTAEEARAGVRRPGERFHGIFTPLESVYYFTRKMKCSTFPNLHISLYHFKETGL